MKVLNLTQLIAEYDRHLERLVGRTIRAPGLTHARKLGLAYYAQAANTVQTLFDHRPWTAHATPGFTMRTAVELAPEKIGFNITEKNNEN